MQIMQTLLHPIRWLQAFKFKHTVINWCLRRLDETSFSFKLVLFEMIIERLNMYILTTLPLQAPYLSIKPLPKTSFSKIGLKNYPYSLLLRGKSDTFVSHSRWKATLVTPLKKRPSKTPKKSLPVEFFKSKSIKVKISDPGKF